MRLIPIAISTAVLFTAPGQAQVWKQGECAHEAERSQTLDAADVRLLAIDAGAGSLKVEGKPGLRQIVLRGRACASDRDLLDDIRLEARRSGSSVVVRSNLHDDRDGWDQRRNHYARLDLVVEVPAGLDVNIDDGSGEIELSHLGNVDLDDGSGSIVANDLASADINDGSGEIRLVDIHGDVDIEDGSGEIELRNIAGAIDIDDGSGEIDVRHAEKSVRIADASGGIDVSDVAGDFIVTDDGSGGIDYDNVRGRVDVPRKKR